MLPAPAALRHYAIGNARRAGVLTAGAVSMAIGVGFLLAALWSAAALAMGPVLASLALAALLVGAGLIVVALAPPAPPRPKAPQPLRKFAAAATPWEPTGRLSPAAEAFLFGVSVAVQLRNRRR
ncbi:MAG: hypothetical protein ACXIVG_07565 [Pararhodobacter sp.]